MLCLGRRRRKKDPADSVVAPAKVEPEDDDEEEEEDSEYETSEASDRQLIASDGVRIAVIHFQKHELIRGYRSWVRFIVERRLLFRGVSYLRNRQLGAGWKS